MVKNNDWIILLILLFILFAASKGKQNFSNKEKIKWVDYKGRERLVTIERSANYG